MAFNADPYATTGQFSGTGREVTPKQMQQQSKDAPGAEANAQWKQPTQLSPYAQQANQQVTQQATPYTQANWNAQVAQSNASTAWHPSQPQTTAGGKIGAGLASLAHNGKWTPPSSSPTNAQGQPGPTPFGGLNAKINQMNQLAHTNMSPFANQQATANNGLADAPMGTGTGAAGMGPQAINMPPPSGLASIGGASASASPAAADDSDIGDMIGGIL